MNGEPLLKKQLMQATFGMSLFVNIAWLFVGSMIAFWIGANQMPWLIVGLLIMVIGIVGINLAVAERNKS